MPKRTKEKFKRKRKPSIFIVCEGRNKTERMYFNHFNERTAPFNLHIVNCESTDVTNMAKKAVSIFVNKQLDLEIGDKVYCLVDLDLEQHKYDKFIKAKNTHKKIEIIPSNPCFEIWLQYYFTKNPKVVNSSQKVKEEMTKYLPDYTESMNIITEVKLGMNEHVIAINNSETRNSYYSKDLKEIEKNPYTEIATIVTELIRYKKEE
jgi:hypothetical protein